MSPKAGEGEEKIGKGFEARIGEEIGVEVGRLRWGEGNRDLDLSANRPGRSLVPLNFFLCEAGSNGVGVVKEKLEGMPQNRHLRR